MSSHITYLIGAGASAKALPMNDSLLSHIKGIITIGGNHNLSNINGSYRDFFYNNYMPIVEEAELQVSLDTLAKLTLTNKEKLHKIKTLIWLYFSSVAGNNKIDPRYTNLLIKMQNNSASDYQIDSRFSFLSWNYDLQMEEAFARIKGIDIINVPKAMYSFPGMRFTAQELEHRNSNPAIYSLIHLNGCAGFYYNSKQDTYKSWMRCNHSIASEYDEMLNLIVQEFHTNQNTSNSLHNCINFAGEQTELNTEKMNYTKDIANRTTHLVIVGYSLPDFNRQIDREIIESMPNLKYVCINDPNADNIKERLINGFPLIRRKIEEINLSIHLDKNQKEFHYPHDI